METIYSSSSTFSPKYEQCNFFSFAVNLPNDLDIIPQYANPIICPKCKSYKVSDDICPICNVAQYPEDSLTSFRVKTESTGNFGRIDIIIFDLSMSLEDLIAISYYLLKESDNNNFEQFRDNAFLFVFLGSNISFLNCIEDEIKFEFAPVTCDFRCFAKPLIYFQNYLIQAIQIAKKYSLPPTLPNNLFDNLISYLNAENVFQFIQDVIYIYSNTIPTTNSKFDYIPRFHFIQFGSSISKSDLYFASQFKASFFTSENIDQSFLLHLQKWLSKSKMIFTPYFTITASNGISFHNFSGPIQNVKIETENRVKVDVFSCSSEMPPIASATVVDKNLYNKSDSFSVQVCLHYHSDLIYAFNAKYQKAKNDIEWVNSLNCDFILFILLQKYSNDLLKSYIDFKPCYQLMPFDLKVDKHCKKIMNYMNSFKKLFGSLLHLSNSIISLNQIIYILYFFTYQSLPQSINLIHSLINDQEMKLSNANYVVFRPFLFINEKFSYNDDNNEFHLKCPIISKLNDQQFSLLQNLLISFQANIFS